MSFSTLEELRAAVGTEVGTSDWVLVDQDRINLFADATDDHQWIHLDPEKAAAGPFGTTIAHGFLTLSLLPFLSAGVTKVDGVKMGVNYGLNKVRFPAPLPAGSKVRAHFKLLSVEDIEGGVQMVTQATIEREGGEKPVCVAETVSRMYL
ncbi:MaoC family dehydratase [Catelliglobosispora koreensis]|uniref:MaoC family dehydratase n=1 Tax=Catelliglobosispora koreensis TaxID=129052 RepID=UPI000381AA3C|nr:MaoC family dehydratase [Catelliglobosispora koreensis]